VLVRAGVPQAGPGVAEDRRTIHLTAKLADDGSAEVKVREQLSGWPAVEWREGLDRLTEDRVRPEFEQHTLGFYFPGAELTALSYGPRDRDAEPFTVEYSFRAPRFARAEGRRLVVPAPFPALLGKRYVGVPLRETPLALAYAVPTTLQATIELPPGASARVAAVERKGAFGTFTLSGRSDGGRLVLSSTFAMPWSRLPPSRYAELTGWARDVDAAEANAAEVQLK
jgi:hypothetical protein